MLTKNEKKWLRERTKLERTKFPVFSCFHCTEGRPMLEKNCVCYDVYPCVAENLVSTKDDVLEAAEFESRVAAKLADPFFPPKDKDSTLEFGHFVMPPMDRLRCARIVVEEELDAEA